MADHTFKFAKKSEELNAVKARALSIMEANEQYKTVLQNIRRDLSEKEKESKLRITFVGAYNAGKSTIISALTGDNDINIDSNISTDKTTTYPWQDVLLVDTPGLGTQHPEHDAETEEAIKQADIVVYCLTFSLFDPLLLKDFEKLAYERGYSEKMFLVVTKIDKEHAAPTYEEKVAKYKKDLIIALGEEKLKKFPLSFIMAHWQLDQDPSLRNDSHFDDFIVHLNDFISANGQMAKVLGPANIFIDNIQQGIIENNDSANLEFQILGRVDRKFRKHERECDSFFQSLIDDLDSKIINTGYKFVNMEHKSPLEYDENCRTVEQQMEQYCNTAAQSLEKKLESVQEELNNDLVQISKSELVRNWNYHQIKSGKISSGSIINNDTAVNVGMLNTIFSNARKGSLALGGLLKFFKPWQATNIARGIGNFTKALGPLMALLAIALDLLATRDTSQREKKEQEHRKNVLAEFDEQADSVKQQFKDEYRKCKEQIIDENLKKIKEMRDQKANEIELTDKTAKELKSCIDEFKRLLSEG